MPWRWGPPNRGIRASVSYATPPYSGASCVCCFLSSRRPPLLPILVVPLFFNRPACSTSRRGDFFFAYSSSRYTRLVLACPVSGSPIGSGGLRRRDVRARRSHLPVRMPCDFLEVSYGTACPVLACPLRCASSVLPLHGTPLVMSSFQSPRSLVSPYGFPSPLAPFLDTPGGEGCLLGICGAFRVRTP